MNYMLGDQMVASRCRYAETCEREVCFAADKGVGRKHAIFVPRNNSRVPPEAARFRLISRRTMSLKSYGRAEKINFTARGRRSSQRVLQCVMNFALPQEKR